jgi:predicted transcriptional regulator
MDKDTIKTFLHFNRSYTILPLFLAVEHYESMFDIVKDYNLTYATVINNVQYLVELGLIDKKKIGRRNEYSYTAYGLGVKKMLESSITKLMEVYNKKELV